MKTFSFCQQFNRYVEYLNLFALKLTNDAHAAKDLFQETALLAFKNQEKFEPGTNMKAWLGTIMHNAFINDFRRKKMRAEIFDNSSNNFYINSGKNRIFNEGEGKMTLEELADIVDDLDEKYKAPFLMAYQGYCYNEICRLTDATLGAVKSRIFMARKRLRAKVLKMYDGSRPLQAA